MRREKGVAGLNVLLSVVTLLFIIGLVVMVFSLMGGELFTASQDVDVNGTAINTTASGVILATSTSIAGVTSWFPIIIVITAMVVLILLTVIIITAIRGSGLVASA